jgi:hypothetical protein
VESGEFIEPTTHARCKLAALYAAVAIAGALLGFVMRPALLAFIEGLPACEQARWSLSLLIAMLLPLPLAAGWVVVYARKLLKFNQSPLPNAWVWRRTPVRRGRPVRAQVCVLILFAVVLAGAPFYGWCVLQPPLWAALRQHCGA